MSSTMRVCASALRATMARARSSSGPALERARAVQPSTALSGVRSSCDKVARNRSFARLAISASCAGRALALEQPRPFGLVDFHLLTRAHLDAHVHREHQHAVNGTARVVQRLDTHVQVERAILRRALAWLHGKLVLRKRLAGLVDPPQQRAQLGSMPISLRALARRLAVAEEGRSTRIHELDQLLTAAKDRDHRGHGAQDRVEPRALLVLPDGPGRRARRPRRKGVSHGPERARCDSSRL